MSAKSPRWIFFRAYLLVALLVLATGLVLENLLEQDAEGVNLQREISMVQGSFLYAESLSLAVDPSTLSAANEPAVRIPRNSLAKTAFRWSRAK